jgi:hypothetical protein
MSKYIQVRCNHCNPNPKHYTIGYTDDLNDPDCADCDVCGNKTEIIPFDQVTDPEFFIEVAGDELENRNHHSRTHLPREMYEAGKAHVAEDKLLEYSKSIYQKFVGGSA